LHYFINKAKKFKIKFHNKCKNYSFFFIIINVLIINFSFLFSFYFIFILLIYPYFIIVIQFFYSNKLFLFILLLLYDFWNKNSQSYYKNIIEDYKSIWNYKFNRNQLYNTIDFYYDLRYVIFSTKKNIFLFLIILLNIKLLFFIYTFFSIFCIFSTYQWIIYYQSFILTKKICNEDYELTLNLKNYNSFFLTSYDLFILLTKIPQIQAYLFIYSLKTKNNFKKLVVINSFKKLLYYKLLGIPLPFLKLWIVVIKILMHPILNINWLNKNKIKWFWIYLWDVQQISPFEINLIMSDVLSYISDCKIKNKNTNNLVLDGAKFMAYEIYISYQTNPKNINLFINAFVNTPFLHFGVLYKSKINKADLFYYTSVYSHSSKLKTQNEHYLTEYSFSNMGVERSRMQYMFPSVFKLESIKVIEIYKPFFKENYIINLQQLHYFYAIKENMDFHKFQLKNDDKVVYQNGTFKQTYNLKELIVSNKVDKKTVELIHNILPKREEDLSKDMGNFLISQNNNLILSKKELHNIMTDSTKLLTSLENEKRGDFIINAAADVENWTDLRRQYELNMLHMIEL